MPSILVLIFWLTVCVLLFLLRLVRVIIWIEESLCAMGYNWLQLATIRPKFFLNSMLGFKSAILAIFQFWQNGTFEPTHGIQKKIWSKDFFGAL